MRLKYIFSLLLLTSADFLFSQNLARLADSVKSGFRGLSVVGEKVVWMSGRKGLVGNSYNGGNKWKWNQVKGFEKSDFRSIYAFDKKNAVIANAGFPATILFTTNAGKSWTIAYTSNDSAMFFDGIDFWDNKHGLIFGDPVNGRMYLSETFDGGKTWKEIPFADCPQLQNGEASFAASGTTIRTLPGGHVYIATGGSVSRLWHSRDYGHHWEVIETRIIQGKPSQGIFSIAFKDTMNGIIVGGDYLNDSLKGNNIFYTNDGGETWYAPENQSIQGYFSCVEYISNSLPNLNLVMITGTFCTYTSTDGGKRWTAAFSYKGSNTIRRKAGKENIVIYYCGGKEGFRKDEWPIKTNTNHN